MCAHSAFYTGSGDLNSGPRSQQALLLTDPSSQHSVRSSACFHPLCLLTKPGTFLSSAWILLPQSSPSLKVLCSPKAEAQVLRPRQKKRDAPRKKQFTELSTCRESLSTCCSSQDSHSRLGRSVVRAWPSDTYSAMHEMFPEQKRTEGTPTCDSLTEPRLFSQFCWRWMLQRNYSWGLARWPSS